MAVSTYFSDNFFRLEKRQKRNILCCLDKLEIPDGYVAFPADFLLLFYSARQYSPSIDIIVYVIKK